MAKEFNREAEKAEMRLTNILVKFQGDKVNQHIDLRSRKMTKVNKLEIWIALLKSKSYFVCAKRASQWLKCIA